MSLAENIKLAFSIHIIKAVDLMKARPYQSITEFDHEKFFK